MARRDAMLQPSDFQLQTLQAVAFLGSGEFQPASILRQILSSYPDIYDGDIISLPSNIDLAPDVASTIIASKDESYRVEVARSRVNLVWQRQNTSNSDLRAITRLLAERTAHIVELAQVDVGRLGSVAIRIAPINHPGRSLAEQYCRDKWLRGPLNRPEGFELHAHKTFALLPDVRVNSWMRIATAKQDAVDYNSISVHQDINSLVEDISERTFNRDEINEFFGSAAEQFEVILNLYFPTDSENAKVHL